MKNLLKASESELRSLCTQLGVDSVGPIPTLVDRIKSVSNTKPKQKRKHHKKTIKTHTESGPQFDIEYVPEDMSDLAKETGFDDYSEILAKFTPREEVVVETLNEDEKDALYDKPKEVPTAKVRKAKRITVAKLKELAKKPEVVDWVDATAKDPHLLVALKSYRNTAGVPTNWSAKRKFLNNLRGVLRGSFNLPDYIKATGIMQMRQAVREKETLLTRNGRQKMAPKMGKLEIDYQKLHDAFFKWQTKPKLTIHGEVFYEGREMVPRLSMKNPGMLSDELKNALNMPPGAPPPWLINMQRYGPPPSYPQLKIQGLNAPIPEGASWGFHPGGWGKAPVDENGNPLYGDVFGAPAPRKIYHNVDRTLWGELEPEVEEEEEEEESDEEEEEEQPEEEPIPEPVVQDTPLSEEFISSGIASVPSGIETPEFIELRKEVKQRPPRSTETKSLYQVLPEKSASIKGFMGSQHVYDLAGAHDPGMKRKADVEVAINPDDLDGLDQEALRKKYNAQLEASKPSLPTEDFSDMVAERAQTEARKRHKKDDPKKKNFKF